MNCPKYVDFTRECLKEIQILPLASLEFCMNGRYSECPFYLIVAKKAPMCEYCIKCALFNYYRAEDSEKFLKTTAEYCFSSNNINCKRYIMRKSGEKPPDDLCPDGTFLNKKTG